MNPFAKSVWDEQRKSRPNDSSVQVEHEVIVADRPDAMGIVRLLHDRGCDLIEMGTRGRTGLLHRVFAAV
jgi:nucleotide-binding universal stress UspA family protein